MLRRDFLSAAGSLAAALALPDRLLADPYGWPDRSGGLLHQRGWLGAPARRVRGRVHAAGRGVAGIGITDGFGTVTTDRDGRYTLLAHPRARFVSVRLAEGALATA